MQKYILTGLSLVSLMTALNARADAADNPTKVKIAGSLSVNGVGVQQKVRTAKETAFTSSGEVRAEISNLAHNGLKYGAIGSLNLDNESSDKVKAAYVSIDHDKYGTVLVGDTSGPANLMGYDGKDLMTGPQGPSGSWFSKAVNVTRGVDMRNNMATKVDAATKVTFLSPTHEGLRVGIGFTPNEGFRGTSTRTNRVSTSSNTSTYGQNDIHAQNAVEGAVSYTHETGKDMPVINMYVAGKAARAKYGNAVKTTGVHPVRTMQTGVIVDFGKINVGGGYFNNGRSYMRKDGDARNWTNTEGYNVAVSYALEELKGAVVSLGHTGSSRRVTNGSARGDVTSVGIDYNIAKGLVVYAAADMFTFKAPKQHINLSSSATQYDYLDNSSSKNANNRGSSVVVGTKIRF